MSRFDRVGFLFPAETVGEARDGLTLFLLGVPAQIESGVLGADASASSLRGLPAMLHLKIFIQIIIIIVKI